jgi:hypothetical protein
MLTELRRGQLQPHDDLAIVIELAGRHEPEPPVEPGGAAVLRDIAGQQFRRPLGLHQLRDLPDDRRAVAAALEPLVDQQLYSRSRELRSPPSSKPSQLPGRAIPARMPAGRAR